MDGARPRMHRPRWNGAARAAIHGGGRDRGARALAGDMADGHGRAVRSDAARRESTTPPPRGRGPPAPPRGPRAARRGRASAAARLSAGYHLPATTYRLAVD